MRLVAIMPFTPQTQYVRSWQHKKKSSANIAVRNFGGDEVGLTNAHQLKYICIAWQGWRASPFLFFVRVEILVTDIAFDKTYIVKPPFCALFLFIHWIRTKEIWYATSNSTRPVLREMSHCILKLQVTNCYWLRRCLQRPDKILIIPIFVDDLIDSRLSFDEVPRNSVSVLNSNIRLSIEMLSEFRVQINFGVLCRFRYYSIHKQKFICILSLSCRAPNESIHYPDSVELREKQ